VDGELTVSVLRKRSDLSPFAAACADLALHCVETSSLAQYRFEGTRCVLVWDRAGSLAGLFPFGAPALYRDLPLVALRSPTPLLRRGRAHAALNALLDWFREDGEGAALLEFRGIRREGPVYRALAEVAREREQLVLATRDPDGSRTLIVGDRTWSELTMSTLPLMRWAKRAAATVIYVGGAEFTPL
jgi:hypothetical protein